MFDYIISPKQIQLQIYVNCILNHSLIMLYKSRDSYWAPEKY